MSLDIKQQRFNLLLNEFNMLIINTNIYVQVSYIHWKLSTVNVFFSFINFVDDKIELSDSNGSVLLGFLCLILLRVKNSDGKSKSLKIATMKVHSKQNIYEC